MVTKVKNKITGKSKKKIQPGQQAAVFVADVKANHLFSMDYKYLFVMISQRYFHDT